MAATTLVADGQARRGRLLLDRGARGFDVPVRWPPGSRSIV